MKQPATAGFLAGAALLLAACTPPANDPAPGGGDGAAVIESLRQEPVAARAARAARIVVGPDYLVSRDSDRPHVEIMAAANPRSPANLLAGAITFTALDGGPATKAYVSRDGGIVWHDVTFPEQREMGGADPQVAFTAAGTAIFATLATGADETGRTRAFLHAYRSEDEGATWSNAYNLGGSYDHPMLAADHTDGPFAGRLYMSVLYGAEYNLGVFRSEDDGRSWLGPVKFIDGGGERGLNVDPMLVLHDGTVVVTYVDFPIATEPAPDDPGSRIWTVVSTDGGVTFSDPQPGPLKLTAAEMQESRQRTDRMRGGSWSMFAVDRSERFRDRIYVIWPEYSRGLPRVVIARTDDRGATWSEPAPVAPPPDVEGAQQFQPAVGVNEDGVLGVTWYDTRDAPGEFAFHQYFAASLDGGATFTAPVRVSSALSRPLGSGNLLPSPTTFNGPAGELRAALLSAASRWVTGGDYMGLAASADGDFHPVWADSRTGTYQVYAARVRVESGTRLAAGGLAGTEGATAHTGEADPNGAARERPSRDVEVDEAADVTGRIDLVTDPGAYDAETRVLDLWVRLENVSSEAVTGPIEVELRKFGSGMGDVLSEFAPEVLNAHNGVAGGGAVFVYDDALGSEGVLPPGGVSGSVLWRLRLADPLRVPDMHLYVRGR